MKDLWNEDVESIEDSKEVEKPKKKRSGAYSKQKGNAYELKIIKELKLLGYDELHSSRNESKRLDNDKIDIAQLPEAINKLPFYVQCKSTQTTPSISQIIQDCPRTDRPLVIFWNKQIKKAVNICSDGEYVMLTKKYFYELVSLEK